MHSARVDAILRMLNWGSRYGAIKTSKSVMIDCGDSNAQKTIRITEANDLVEKMTKYKSFDKN
ncbi:hypothetical protein DsansV1_C21g0168011 [Dioscorea sansibarensis]